MRHFMVAMISALLWTGVVCGAELASPEPIPGRVMLPQDHQYQRVLRAYMATLTEDNFAHGVTAKSFKTVDWEADLEARFQQYIYARTRQPKVGFKRGIPAVNAPAWLFLLSTIEGPETRPISQEESIAGFEARKESATLRDGPISVPTGIVIPPVWPDALIQFTQWDYPGNHFYDNKALKMRAFVTAVVRMIMLDEYLATGQQNRSDWNAYKFVTFAFTFQGVRDLLPEPVQAAYREGLNRFAQRLLDWGVHGEDISFDITMPLAMWYATQTCSNPEIIARAAAFAETIFTDPAYLHPAGYWVERGGVDIGFAGMANNFAIWTALASRWPFAEEAIARIYRLRAHLTLPEPDGSLFGPSHFNNRLGTPSHADQWDWEGMRDLGAFMVTDEAASAIARPSDEDLENAPARSVSRHNSQIYGSLRNPYNPYRSSAGNYGYILDENLRGNTWSWRIWDTFNYPLTVNYAAAYYRPDAYARLTRLEAGNPAAFESPYVRGETFLRNFGDAFFAVRQESFGAILHTGPVGSQDPDDGFIQFAGPMGFGGGQLSAFWTPATGSAILGLRMGMNPDNSFDTLTMWRQWPIHAVSGITAEGNVFSSSRILKPAVSSELTDRTGTVTVQGDIPGHPFSEAGQGQALVGRMQYQREFTLNTDSIGVRTTVNGDGQDVLAEMFETIPVLIQRSARVADESETTVIEFQTGGEWTAAGPEALNDVTAIRLTRFKGAQVIAFDKPQRVKLSPEAWISTWLPRGVVCRSILIDLLGRGEAPASLEGQRSVEYTIRAE